MSSTGTMRASFLYGQGRLGVETIEIPAVTPGSVLIRISAVGVCGSDIHYWEHGGIGDHLVLQPMILGHEASGVVEGVGDGVSRDWIGKRVSIEPGVPDGTCEYCRTGRYNLCPNMVFFATPPVNGAFVEYVVHPVAFIYELPDGVSDDAGGLIEPLSVGIWSVRQAGVRPAESVLITGAGPVGLMAAQVARAAGVTNIYVSDVSEYRRHAALRFGATEVIDPLSDAIAGLGVHAYIDCSGAPSAITSGIEALRPGGAAVLVGIGGKNVTLPMGLVQDRELSVRGIYRYANTWPTGIELAARGLVDLDGMVTAHYDLDSVESALTPDPTGHGIKAIVNP
ncbi:MAG: NAD(P)-dependent alcohol dehydrogenase [Cryobacterium sp.]|nr:NAD(P)-dependent alcohol dehydrogenase [Cryobacterium sp.]